MQTLLERYLRRGDRVDISEFSVDVEAVVGGSNRPHPNAIVVHSVDDLADVGDNIEVIIVETGDCTPLAAKLGFMMPEPRVMLRTFDINRYVDKVFYINMDRSPDRRRCILEEFERAGIWNFERQVGVEIKGPLPEHKLLGPFAKTNKDKYQRGALGCLMSHREIIVKSIARGYNRICIIEDDMTIVPNFPERFHDYAASIQTTNFQLAYLAVYLKDPDKYLYIPTANKNCFQLQRNCIGTWGFLVNNQGWVFKHLLANFDHMMQEVDLIYNGLVVLGHFRQVYVSDPFLVVPRQCESLISTLEDAT